MEDLDTEGTLVCSILLHALPVLRKVVQHHAVNFCHRVVTNVLKTMV